MDKFFRMNAYRPRHWDAPKLCLQEDADRRTTMPMVNLMLNSNSASLPAPFPPALFVAGNSLVGWSLTQIRGKILSQTVILAARKACLIMRLSWLILILANARFKQPGDRKNLSFWSKDLACILYNYFNTYLYFRSCWYDCHCWRLYLRSLTSTSQLDYWRCYFVFTIYPIS